MKRPISQNQSTWLHDELEAWRAEAILSDEQAGRILGLYETPDEAALRHQSRAVFTLMGVAALLVALAALLLVGYNWEQMPRALKVAIIFGVILSTHAAGLYLRFQQQAKTWSEIVLFLGCLFYGVGIWLIAQVFHLNAHYPDGVWWWALGVLPFALCLDTLLLHALYAALLAIWVGVEVLGSGHPISGLARGWLPLFNTTISLPILALPGLLWAYRKGSPTAVALYVPVLAWWLILQPVAWGLRANPIYFIGGVSALFLVLAECHRVGSPFAIPYRLYGLLGTCGVLAVLSFHDFHKHRARGVIDHTGLVETLAIGALAAAVLVFTVAVKRRGETAPLSFAEQARAVLRRQWLPAALVLLMAAMSLYDTFISPLEGLYLEGLIPTVLANAAMIAVAIWLIGFGLREDRGRLFAAGVLYFLLWSVLRYIDLFGDFGGMLGAALMFFLCGAALFGVALYWRRRKEVRHV